MLQISLLDACSGMLAHFEEKYALRGLHLNFSKKENAAQLIGLSTGDGQRGLLEVEGPLMRLIWLSRLWCCLFTEALGLTRIVT